ncbi:MAG TPA: helix-turn-helix transcriptional regulator [Lacipirellulaceae bacterium]|nr:helix-turn-helix transcriptional regulator [Lacipirellulaceae bacterium]
MTSHKLEPVDHLIAANIRYYRSLRGLTREMLAKRVDMSPGRLRCYETGQSSIGAAGLLQIARALEVPIGQFFAGDVSKHI